MESVIIFKNDDQQIEFSDYLKLCRFVYQYNSSKIIEYKDELQMILFDIEIKSINTEKFKHTSWLIKGVNIKNLEVFSKYAFSIQEYFESAFDNLMNRFVELRFKKDFIVKNAKFQVFVELESSEQLYPLSDHLRIQVKSGNKLDEYYYNLKTGKICIKNKDRYVEVSPNMQKAIISLLPKVATYELGQEFTKYIYDLGEDVYALDNGIVKEGSPTFFESITNSQIKVGKRFVIEEESKKEEVQPAFSELVNDNNYSLETSKNAESIINNIKTLLTRLKNSTVNVSDMPRIKINESIFFKSITTEKKEIDPFFKDPQIIKFCDLSGIDFINADIRGFTLSGTEAKIDLQTLYNKSVEGTDLEGINLCGQELDGINANNANLKGTGVCVSIDRASIIGTKFSDFEIFMLGLNVLTKEQVLAMGIDIETQINDEQITLSTNGM